MEEFHEKTRVYESKAEALAEEVRNVGRLIDQNSLRCEDAQRKILENKEDYDLIKTKVVTIENELNQSLIVVEGANLKLANRQRELDDLQNKRELISERMTERSAEVADILADKDRSKQESMKSKARLEALEEIEKTEISSKNAMNKFISLSESTAFLLTNSLSLNEKSSDLSKAALSAFETWADRVFLKEPDRFEEIANICKKDGAAGFSVTLSSSYDIAQIKNCINDIGAVPLANYLDVDEPELYPLVERIAYLNKNHPEEISEFPAGLILFTKSGLTFTGGDDVYISDQNAKGSLSRRKEIEKLFYSSSKLEKTVTKLEEKIDKVKIDQLKDQGLTKEIEREIQEKNTEVMRAMTEYESSKSNAEIKQEQIINLRENLAVSEASVDRLEKEIERLSAEITSLESQKIRAEEEREQLLIDNESAADENTELKRQYESARIDLASASAKADSLREGFEEKQQRLQTLEERVNKKQDSLTKLELDISEASLRKDTLEKDIESFIVRRSELEDTLTSKRESNASIIEEMRVIENRAKENVANFKNLKRH